MSLWYSILTKIFNMSITASIAIAAILVIRYFLRNAPKIFSYLLWSVVLFRLLCPVSFSSAFSMLNLADISVTEQGAVTYIPMEDPSSIYPTDGLSVPDSTNDPSVPSVPVTSTDRTDDLGQARTSAQKPMVSTGWPFALGCIWLSGVAVLVAYSIISLRKMRKKISCSMKLYGNIYLADNISSPFVAGLSSPKIYLPSALDPQAREYIILHEQHHIRRGDHIIKIVAFFTLCLHWFNPLVWLAFLLSGADMEMSCDEAVMKKLDDDARPVYASLLLQLATGRYVIAGTPLAFGEGDPKKRIKNVMRYKKPALSAALVAAAVCAVVAVCLLTNPKNPKNAAKERASMAWARSLKSTDVDTIELLVQPQTTNRQYKRFVPEMYGDIVGLINQSEGTYIKKYEDLTGQTITFYIKTKDGTIHDVSNIGNVYLSIDGDRYEADYDWLSSWEQAYGQGDSRVPEDFLEQVESTSDADGSEFVASDTAQEDRKTTDGATDTENEIPGYTGTERNDSENTASMNSTDAITKAIMEHEADSYPIAHDYACCNFLNLPLSSKEPFRDKKKNTVTFYGLALYGSYQITKNGIEDVGGSHCPVALTFDVSDNTYVLKEYWRPRDGSYYVSDIKEKFPAQIVSDALNASDYVDLQIQDCYAQAIEYSHLDTDAVIKKLLHSICSEPLTASSNPQDWIDADDLSYLDYRELYYYGDYTVRYCLQRFAKGNETGLEGHIMALICQDILDVDIPSDAATAATGQEWYEALKAHASNIIEKFDISAKNP